MNFIYHLHNFRIQIIQKASNVIQKSLEAENSGLSGYDASTICNRFLTLQAKAVASSSRVYVFK
jgi:hypothetical protein